jgi:putative hydrolase of the HAD superfamily
VAAVVQVYLLDIDDTLVDTQGAFRHALSVVGESYLPEVPSPDELVKVWRADVNGWYRAFTRGELDYREQRKRRANELHALYGGPEMDDGMYAVWDEEFELEFREGWIAHDDVAEFLDELEAAGVKYGAVSNAAIAYQTAKLKRAGLSRVPMLVGTDTFGVGKPDPRVFVEGARLLGADVASAVYVGDELDIDARAAVAAGCAAGVWVDRPGDSREARDVELGEAIVKVASLSEVLGALEGLSLHH